MARVLPGYIGILDSSYGKIRCSEFNVVREQNPLFYDHTIGLRDTIPQGNTTKGEGEDINLQKTIMRHGTKIISGSFSFNPDESTSIPFFEEAKRGTDLDMSFGYICSTASTNGFNFSLCRVNSFSLTATAGDIVSVSVDVMGKIAESTNITTDYSDAKKLITWDKVSVIGKTIGVVSGVQAFSLNINNNLMPIYTANSNYDENLLPLKLRVGMQEVTGSITIYGVQASDFTISNEEEIELTVGDFSTPINLVFNTYRPEGLVGPIITTIPFVGIDRAFGI